MRKTAENENTKRPNWRKKRMKIRKNGCATARLAATQQAGGSGLVDHVPDRSRPAGSKEATEPPGPPLSESSGAQDFPVLAGQNIPSNSLVKFTGRFRSNFGWSSHFQVEFSGQIRWYNARGRRVVDRMVEVPIER